MAGPAGLVGVAAVQARANGALKRANDATTQALIQVQDEQAKTQAALEQIQAEQVKTQAALTRATDEEQKARQSASESKAVLEFFQEQVLAAARPEGQEGGLGKDVTIRKAVDAAEPKIAGAFKGQPTIEASVRAALGATYWYLGEPGSAIRQQDRALELRTAKLGPEHPETLSGPNNLAMAFVSAGQLDRAIPLFERTLAAQTAQLGPDHPNTLTTQNNLADAYQSAGGFDRAIPLFERTLAAMTAKRGADHPDTLTIQNNVAWAYRMARQFDRAIPLLERTLAAQTAKLGPDHPDTLTTQNNLAVAYRDAGRLNQAIPLLERTVTAKVGKLGPDHPDTLLSQNNLAVAYQAAGQLDRAEALLRDGVERARKRFGPAYPRTSMDLLGLNLLKQAKWAEAGAVLRECLAIREKAHPDDWGTFNTRSQLGGSLLGLKKYAEAEPLIVSGYEGMKAREAKIPPEGKPWLTEAAERIMKLYEAWAKPEKATTWKSKLGMPDLPAEVFAPP
jgi:tetratricopeptide (TPR) repeat protein